MEQQYSFLTRLSMAFKMIFSRQYTETLFQPAEIETPVAEPIPEIVEADADSALQLIALLQKEGRLIDFINEDVNSFSDDQVAAAARVVHQGVKKALDEHLTFAPASDAQEGNSVSLDADFDRSTYRLTGNITGSAPYRGTVIHKGWKVTDIKLPAVVDGTDLNVVAAAEVEL